MRTIGQTALLFADNREAAVRFLDDLVDDPLYEGSPVGIPVELCKQLAPLHPKWHSYQVDAAAILYQGSGPFRHGTECPKRAMESFADRPGKGHAVGQTKFPYVIIWNPLAQV